MVVEPSTTPSLLEFVRGASTIALDFESTGLRPYRDKVKGAAVARENGQGEVEAHYYTTEQFGWTGLRQDLAQILGNSELTVVCHNAKFDMGFLKAAGVQVKSVVVDTMAALQLLDERQRKGLKEAAKLHLGANMAHYDEASSVEGLFPEVFHEYAEDDARQTLCLWRKLAPQVEAEGFGKLFKLECDMVPIVMGMEANGVQIDTERLGAAIAQYEEQLEGALEKCRDLGGQTFDPMSAQQVSMALEKQLLAEGADRGKGGLPSSAERWLAKAAAKNLLAREVLRYREAHTLLSLNLRPMRGVDPDGRLRPQINQFGARTGRWSMSEPNLMQVSRDKRIRSCIVARPGWKLVIYDYGQMELRVGAHVAGDEAMIHALNSGMDIHQMTADALGCSRDQGKTLNFALIYGVGAQKVSDSLGIPLSIAKAFRARFFAMWPGFARFHREVGQALDAGPKEVYSITGRRRRLGDLDEGSRVRTGVNDIVQASAVDIVKIGMRKLWEKQGDDDRVLFILQVHDEIVQEVGGDIAEDVVREGNELLASAVQLRVPLSVSGVIADSWAGKK